MILNWDMLRKAEDNYELLWEMVYHNPKEVKGTPARLLVKVNTKHPLAQDEGLYTWIEEHRDQIAQAVLRAVKNKTSVYRCLKVFKVPFYSDHSL